MRKVAACISKMNISLIPNLIQYCDLNQINECILLLFGEIYGENSIVEKDGLKQLVNALPKQTNIDIHIVREGLGYTLSANDVHEIFDSTIYKVETSYSCMHDKYQLNFISNNLEDSYWDDQYFSELQKQASSKNSIKISAIYKPYENDYMSSWGKGAWKLSNDIKSTLIYLDDKDMIEFNENCVYKLYLSENKKLKIKEY